MHLLLTLLGGKAPCGYLHYPVDLVTHFNLGSKAILLDETGNNTLRLPCLAIVRLFFTYSFKICIVLVSAPRIPTCIITASKDPSGFSIVRLGSSNRNFATRRLTPGHSGTSHRCQCGLLACLIKVELDASGSLAMRVQRFKCRINELA